MVYSIAEFSVNFGGPVDSADFAMADALIAFSRPAASLIPCNGSLGFLGGIGFGSGLDCWP